MSNECIHTHSNLAKSGIWSIDYEIWDMGYWGVKNLGYGILGVKNLGYGILGGKISWIWDMGTPVSPPPSKYCFQNSSFALFSCVVMKSSKSLLNAFVSGRKLSRASLVDSRYPGMTRQVQLLAGLRRESFLFSVCHVWNFCNINRNNVSHVSLCARMARFHDFPLRILEAVSSLYNPDSTQVSSKPAQRSVDL